MPPLPLPTTPLPSLPLCQSLIPPHPTPPTPQVFRTEHWARVLGNKASLPLMSVVLATTMIISGLAAVVANPSAVAAVLEHPVATEHLLMSGSLPWLSVAYTGLVTTDLALLMELMALHDVPSTDAAIIYSLEPLLGASLAWVLLGERWGTAGWFGAALIMASSLVTQVGAGEGWAGHGHGVGVCCGGGLK